MWACLTMYIYIYIYPIQPTFEIHKEMKFVLDFGNLEIRRKLQKIVDGLVFILIRAPCEDMGSKT